jgi:glycosyltransferase involved in cell wall biosynthesis
MKILFLISSINSKSNGKGGHYHSLLETVKQMSKKHEVIIVNIGNKPAEALLNSNFKTYWILNKISIYKTYAELKKIIKEEKPDILHSFDALAFYWTRISGRMMGIRHCLTKCGGEDPKYYPYAKNLILFSSENELYFKSQYKFRDSNLFLIPNRIQQFEDNVEGIEEIQKNLKKEHKNSFKFLRITRIGNYYKKSSLQLIQLVKKLRKEGLDCCLIFIGTVEEEFFIKELIKEGEEFTYFFTNIEYTKDAKSFINCADAVMGTGRSFMEAAAKGKILLSPIKNGAIPMLIESSNFAKAFKFNFSERIFISDYDEIDNYNSIKATIESEFNQKEAQVFSTEIYSDFFDSKKITEKHENVYSGIQIRKDIHLMDLFFHTLFLLRSYYR